jgi:hypothetical protein
MREWKQNVPSVRDIASFDGRLLKRTQTADAEGPPSQGFGRFLPASSV